MKIVLTNFTLWALLLLAAQSSMGKDAPEAKLSAELESILTWLPPDTETLIVTNGPIDPFNRTIEDAVSAYKKIACLQFSSFKPAKFHQILRARLKEHQAIVAVEGSQNFRLPEGGATGDQGMMIYDGCQFLVFDEELSNVLAETMENCLAEALETKNIRGTSVAVFSYTYANRDWPILIANPEPNLLVCSTSESYLSKIIQRMKNSGKGRAFPDDLNEWKYVDIDAEVWGMRHYKRPWRQGDPTSPLGPAQSIVNLHDSVATGFTFACRKAERASGDRLEVHYFSDAVKAPEIATKGWSTSNATPENAEFVAPGVVKIDIQLGGANGMQVYLLLLAHLGHAILI